MTSQEVIIIDSDSDSDVGSKHGRFTETPLPALENSIFPLTTTMLDDSSGSPSPPKPTGSSFAATLRILADSRSKSPPCTEREVSRAAKTPPRRGRSRATVRTAGDENKGVVEQTTTALLRTERNSHDVDDGLLIDLTCGPPNVNRTQQQSKDSTGSVAGKGGGETSSVSSRQEGGRRDRDEVEVVIARELGDQLIEKLRKSCERERNVNSCVDALVVPNMVQWRRRSTECPSTVDAVGYYYTGEQLADIVRENGVDALSRTFKERHRDQQMFVLVMGAQAYCRRRLARRRATGATGGGTVVSYQVLEDALNGLYVNHGISGCSVDSVEEVAEFCLYTAYAVGRRPHRDQLTAAHLRSAYVHSKTSAATAALCVGAGGSLQTEQSSRLGAAYQAFLAMVPGVSVGRAKAIRGTYPTLARLMEAYERCATQKAKEELLSSVAERGKRTIGAKLSARIATALNSADGEIDIS